MSTTPTGYTSSYTASQIDRGVELGTSSYVPTLNSAPTASTKTFTLDGDTIDFRVGGLCRVADTDYPSGYKYYQLRALTTSGSTTTATWEELVTKSQAAASGGTTLSLVTTGEKYAWNNKSELEIGNTSSTAAAGNHTHDSRYMSLVGGTGTAIAKNTDLDTILTAGTYYSVDSTTTNTLSNCPYSGSNMKMVVQYDGLTNYGRQIIYGYANAVMWVRSIKNGAVDGDWKKVLYASDTLDATKLSGTIPSECYTDTTYESKAASSGGTAVSLCTTGEKYTWEQKQAKVSKLGSTTKPVYTSAAGTFAECSTYAGGTAVTLNGTSKAANTASFYAPTGAGTSGYLLKSGGSSTAPSWIAQTTIAPGISIATDSGDSSISLAAGTKYKLTVGGSTYVFTTPSDTNTKVTQSSASADVWRKLLFSYQNGTSGAAVESTTNIVYANKDIEVNPSSGTIRTPIVDATTVRASGNNVYVGSASGSQCHQQYDTTNKCLKFIFD